MSKIPIYLLFVFALVILGTLACTTSGIAGLAKEEYVLTTFEQTKTEQDQELEEIREKIRELSGEIKDMQDFLDEFEDLAKMQELANNVEARLKQMPEETLLMLFDILKEYLGK